jgi:hypothetical protein
MTPDQNPPSEKRSKSVLWPGLALVAICLVGGLGPAFAQLPPDDDEGQAVASKPSKKHAKATESSADAQPYYVDGVEYKPYVPDAPQKPSRSKHDAGSDAADDNNPDVSPLVPGYVPKPAPKSSLAADTHRAKSTVTGDQGGSDDDQASQAHESQSSSSAAPLKRPRYGVAIIRALDKVTAESVMFEVPVGETRRYKGLTYTVKACETNAPDEARPDVMAYLEISTVPFVRSNEPTQPAHLIFRGWTFAASPGINAMQHAVYDAWVVNCKDPKAIS